MGLSTESLCVGQDGERGTGKLAQAPKMTKPGCSGRRPNDY
jgi:hypothetical protein